MSNIRVLIVEDNSLTAEAIAVMLKKQSIEVVEICATGEDAIVMFKKEAVDLVLMDIVLAGALDGVSTAEALRANRRVPIIYLTDHTDPKFIERAKKTYPVNYLAKPFTEAGLVRAVEFAFNNLQDASNNSDASQQGHIFVRTENQGFVRLMYSEILFLKAARSYCRVVTDKATYTLCSSMNQVQDQLGNKDFIRVHRSHVVNTKRITRLEGNILYLNESKLDMGREYRDDLVNSLKLIR
jgi:DNA-binding LytR/AlgR family response regulator